MSQVTTVKIFNTQGEVVKELPLPEKLLSLKINPTLVHQVVVADGAAARAGTAHTKNRSEVSGGGKKPWKQKGTGRARHGSIRSPIWVGGGVVFGPRNTRNYVQRTPAAWRNLARAMVLLDYLQADKVLVVSEWPTESKTKVAATWLKNIKLSVGRKYLMLLSDQEKVTARIFRNLPRLTVSPVSAFNAYLGLQNQRLILSAEAFNQLLNNCLKSIKESKK